MAGGRHFPESAAFSPSLEEAASKQQPRLGVGGSGGGGGSLGSDACLAHIKESTTAAAGEIQESL